MSRPDLLGPALRRLRLERDERQREVAQRAGLTRPMLSNYERGRRRPSPRNLAALLQALEADQTTLHRTMQRLAALGELALDAAGLEEVAADV